jgi:hypothetical protein
MSLNPDIMEVMRLIDKANESGTKILLKGNSLQMLFAKGERPDPEILQQVKENKERIIQYLTRFGTSSFDVITEENSRVNPLEFEGDLYYDLTPTQLYWADEDKDKEYKSTESSHGIIVLRYEISGAFEGPLFRQAIGYVTRRHESLRAVFRKVAGKYRMKVVSSLPETSLLEMVDIREQPCVDPTLLASMTKQEDRKISLGAGPLFLFRLIRTGEQNYILSIKLHHIISDTWSVGVLLKNLLEVYRDLYKQRIPRLPALPIQCKEFMAFANNYRDTYAADHKAYWQRLYPGIPGELHLPGTLRSGNGVLQEKIGKTYPILFPREVRLALNALSRDYETTLFIVLQATFKSFLFYKTGQPDLLVGTAVSGRDYPATYEQIGCYARTDLIRTILDKDDTFKDALLKVRRSNKDLATYRAFTLTGLIDELLPPGGGYTAFWKVNMLFYDMMMEHSFKENMRILDEELPFQISHVLETTVSVMPIDIILDFSSARDELILKVHYDSTLYDEEAIGEIFREYLQYTQVMTGDTSRPVIPAHI